MMRKFLLAVVGLAIFSVASAFTMAPYSSSTKCFVATRSAPQFLSQDPNVGDIAGEEPAAPAVKCPKCDLCDGSGRILGGIAVVLPWWPIKAYRPCPTFIDNGGRYIRSGQPLDEIAFGRDSTYDGGS